MTATAQPSVTSPLRRRLLVGMAALAAVQLVHLIDVLRYDDDASFPGVLGDPQAVVGIGLAAVAMLLLALQHPAARAMTITASVVVALGFVLHHGIPFDLDGVNNPYWTFGAGNRADWFRWTTVLVLIALGAWTATTALRAPRAEFDGGR